VGKKKRSSTVGNLGMDVAWDRLDGEKGTGPVVKRTVEEFFIH